MSITELSIKRPSLIIVTFTVLICAGLFCYKLLNYELMPPITVPTLVISTPYPGAAPFDVEQSVTKRIEDIVSSASNVTNIISQSYEGASVIVAEFKTGTDIDKSQQDLQQKIDQIKSNLPEGAKDAAISQVTPSDQPIMQLTLNATTDEKELFDLVENEILPNLQQISGVGEISVTGGIEREIKINVNREKLKYYGLSLPYITQAINAANLDFPTGKVKDESSQTIIRLAGKFSSVSEIENLSLSLPAGGKIRLMDLADVVDGIKEQKTINRFNGIEGIGIAIKKQSNANAVEISASVIEKIHALETKYAGIHMKFNVADNTSDFTLLAADSVMHDLFIAVVLVAIVMLVFLHSLRDSFIVLLAIPSSLISSFTAMYLFGFSLNLMTLLAMSLVIGILVDDSIVILENMHKHLAMGKSKEQAAIDGRKEIGFSAVAITLVDVVVFAPIAMINNEIGDVLRQFSLTIVVTTLLSLFVSFTLTPWLYSRFGKITALNPKNWFQKPLIAFEHFFERLTNGYVENLKWVLNHKIITSVVILFLFVFTAATMGLGILGQEVVSMGDRGKFSMKLEYDKSIPFAKNNQTSRKIENLIMSKKEVVGVLSNIGISGSDILSTLSGLSPENKSELTIELVDYKLRSVTTEQLMIDIKNEVERKFAGVKAKVNIIGLMTGGAEPIQIVLNSENKDELMEVASRLYNKIKMLPGTNNASLSVENGNPELDIIIDRDKMAQLGLSMNLVGATLQNGFSGNTDAKLRSGNNEYDINVKMDAFNRRNISDISSYSFQNAQNAIIPLSQFAAVNQSSGPAVLERKNRRTSITIKCDVLGITSGKLAENIKKVLAENPIPSTIDLKWGGDIERQEKSFSALGTALLAAIILVYLVMVALYDSFVHPFVVLFSIPVALIGAFLALNLTMGSMSIFTMLGIIMLLGLVSKNGILIVDFANHLRNEGHSTYDALIEAGKERLRPIMMTTLAMVIGMLPIALAKGAGSEWKNDLAWVIIGGLSSSLVLTVFVVPMMYLVIDKIKDRLKTTTPKTNLS